jgi:hypothetical protein
MTAGGTIAPGRFGSAAVKRMHSREESRGHPSPPSCFIRASRSGDRSARLPVFIASAGPSRPHQRAKLSHWRHEPGGQRLPAITSAKRNSSPGRSAASADGRGLCADVTLSVTATRPLGAGASPAEGTPGRNKSSGPGGGEDRAPWPREGAESKSTRAPGRPGDTGGRAVAARAVAARAGAARAVAARAVAARAVAAIADAVLRAAIAHERVPGGARPRAQSGSPNLAALPVRAGRPAALPGT